MRKISAMLISILLMFLWSITIFSAEPSVPGGQDIGVYAKAVYTLPDGCYAADLENGRYTVTLPDGTVIIVIPENVDEEIRLVVCPIEKDEREAYEWFTGCTRDFGVRQRFYEIYFIDSYGNRVKFSQAAGMRIILEESYKKPLTAILSTQGELTEIETESDGKVVSFPFRGAGYYVLAESVQSVGRKGPKTGDGGDTLLWIVLLLLSIASFTALSIKNRKRRLIL